MHTCNAGFVCELGNWLQTHPYVILLFLSGAFITLVAEGIYVVRFMRERWQNLGIREQLREERENEWKVFQHKTRSLVLQGQEWDVDMSDLQNAVRRLSLMHTAVQAIKDEKALLTVPLLPLFILVAIGSWIPTLWMLIVFLIVFGMSIVWWIYHIWKWHRYRWAFNVLVKANEAAVKNVSTMEEPGT